MLEDLAIHQSKAVDALSKIENLDVEITAEFKERYSSLDDRVEITWFKSSARSKNLSSNQFIYFPYSWFLIAHAMSPYIYQILEYKKTIRQLFDDFGEGFNTQRGAGPSKRFEDFAYDTRAIGRAHTESGLYDELEAFLLLEDNGCALTASMEQMCSVVYESSEENFKGSHDDIKSVRSKELFRAQGMYELYLDSLKEMLSKHFGGVEDKKRLVRFLFDYDYWEGSRPFSRPEFAHNPTLSIANLVNASQGEIGYITQLFAENPTLREFLKINEVMTPIKIETEVKSGKNTIHYGAAGTGKSFSLNSSPNIIRTVFHMESINSDFLGSYRPYKTSTGITYEFIEGPFIKAFINAINLPEEEHTLIIEEINRADCGSVFGQIFQLLDRRDGESEYRISVERSLDDFLKEKLEKRWDGMLYIPSNLSLVATMNSSDQGVQPMDSAFKRRWQFVHHQIDFNIENTVPYIDEKLIDYSGREFSWKEIGTAINELLSNSLNINEDRLLGQFFLTKEDISSKENVIGKLFIYLWDDVLRHNGREIVFKPKYKSFTALSKAYLEGKDVFSDQLEELLVRE